MFGCILFVFIIPNLPFVVQSQRHLSLRRQTQHKQGMFPTALGFPKGIRVTDHESVLATEAIHFSQELLAT